MSRTAKWILAILIGIVLVGAVAVTGLFVASRLTDSGFILGPRAFQFWEGRRALPPQVFRGLLYTPLRVIYLLISAGRWLVFPCLLALIGLGVIALVFSLARPGRPPAAAPPASAAASAAPAGKNCPNCGRPVQEDWNHCPYCGSALTPPEP